MKNKPYLRRFSIEGEFEQAYLNNVPALKNLKSFEFNSPITYFVGENGSGKSTLIEALAINYGFNAEGGTINFNFATNKTHSTLYKNISIEKSVPYPSQGFFLRAESFYNVATELERLDKIGLGGVDTTNEFMQSNYGVSSLHGLSHGESFLALALNKFRGKSIFFLDEPESALSPSRQMALLVRMHELVNEKCQFIIATHSPILMSYPNAEIVELTENSAVITPYSETEHYVITKAFLDNPKKVIDLLLEK